VKFVIDNIPSLADAMPYSSYVVLYGDESDGVPEPLDGGDTLPREPAKPPHGSNPLAAFDKTAQYRRIA
jgi:hypothetical protein